MRSRRASVPLFVTGISLIGTGIGWEVTALWVAGLGVMAVGLAILAYRPRR